MPVTLNKNHGHTHSHAQCDHVVKFYESDAVLVELVASFFNEGFVQNEVAILIATPSHTAAIEKRLETFGRNISELKSEGLYSAMDAATTLGKFMVNGMPDEQLFRKVVGKFIGRTLRAGRSIRAFGEMVALLWEQKNGAGALKLEEIWTAFQGKHRFSLLCAYPMKDFAAPSDGPVFNQICSAHTAVIASEELDLARLDPKTALTVSVLQQQASALRAEIAERRLVERQLRDFLETATEGIHQVGPDGRILWANRAELEMLGYSAEEYIGRCIQDFHYDAPVIADILDRLKRGERLINYEARLRCKDGTVRYVLINSNVHWENERFGYTKCFSRDITDRKIAEVGNQLLSAIVESSDDAIVSKDLNGTITSWNKGAERVFGYSAAEVVGKSITILIPPDRLDEEPRILAQIRSGQRIDHFATIRRRKDGSLINVSITVSPVRNGVGEIIGASKVARDITDTIRAQEKLERTVAERTAHLRATIGELERFSYSLSHDMRAPLRAIHSFIQIVLDEAGARLGEQERDYLEKSVKAARRLDRLIQDVLSYSKVARDAIELQPIDVMAVVRQIIDERPEFQPPVSEIDIECVTPFAMGHEAYLTQIATNLLDNAVKFVASGVRPKIRITCDTRGDHVRICFDDNGIGIAPDAREKIFGMFQRMHSEAEYEGTGIGLAIARKAAERMNGTIGVESSERGGSRFWIELPAVPHVREVQSRGPGLDLTAEDRVFIEA
jgi:hypothetical protein